MTLIRGERFNTPHNNKIPNMEELLRIREGRRRSNPKGPPSHQKEALKLEGIEGPS